MAVSVSELPEVKPVALDLKPRSDLASVETETDVSNDYGTPNVLFLYYVPFLDEKPGLDAIQDEFQTWNAWELGQAEAQLMRHVEAGNLPSDDSIASRVTRNNFRSKAIDFFRTTTQTWLSLTGNKRDNKAVKTSQDEVNGAVLQGLRALAEQHQLQSQFGVVLNAISGNVHAEQENKFYFSHVHYKYECDPKKFLPVVLDTTFTVKVQGGEGSEAGEDGILVETNLSTNFYSFDRKFWRDNRHVGEGAIKMGEPIRKQMAIDFYVDG